MPRFHFHVLDGAALVDDCGVELRDIAAAKIEAIKFAGAVLSSGSAGEIWQGEPWRLVVNDSSSPSAGKTYFTLTLSAAEPPGLKME